MADPSFGPEAKRILSFLHRNWLEWFSADRLAWSLGMSPHEAWPHIEALHSADLVRRAEGSGIAWYRAKIPARSSRLASAGTRDPVRHR
jgi:hypothetical protein